MGAPQARLNGEPVAVTKASRTGDTADAEPGSVGPSGEDGVRVAASDEWIVVRRLHVDGQARPAAAVLEPGMRLEDG